jgi:tetratricopeptide (TPR) repeat protein
LGIHPREVHSLFYVGGDYYKLGQYQQAIQFFQQSLNIARQTGYRSMEANILSSLGKTFYSLQQYQKAIKWYQQSITVIESIQGDLKIEELKASFAAGQIDSYEQLIALLLGEGRFEEVFNYVERARARAFLDQFANGPINSAQGFAPNSYNGKRHSKHRLLTSGRN